MKELVVETKAAGQAAAAEVCPLPAAPSRLICPNCRRDDVLVAVGEALFCAACGYASDGAAGCT